MNLQNKNNLCDIDIVMLNLPWYEGRLMEKFMREMIWNFSEIKHLGFYFSLELG